MNPLHAVTCEHQHKDYESSISRLYLVKLLPDMFLTVSGRWGQAASSPGNIKAPATRGTSTVKIPLPGNSVWSTWVNFPVKLLQCQSGLNALNHARQHRTERTDNLGILSTVLWSQNIWRIGTSWYQNMLANLGKLREQWNNQKT